MNAADVMSRDLVTLGPGHSVRHAARMMLDHRLSGLPVLDDAGHLVGILTEGDLIRRAELGIAGYGNNAWAHGVSPAGLARDFVRTHSWRVGDIMTSPVQTVTEDAPLARIAALLDTARIKRLPVVRDGRLVGIVSRADLLRVIADAEPDPLPGGDEAIRRSVETRLRDCGQVLTYVPRVTVSNGVVHLWGDVPSEAERDAARVVAEAVPGIAALEDHLSVVAPAARP